MYRSIPVNAESYVFFYIQLSKTALTMSDMEIKCDCTSENFRITKQAIVLIPNIKERYLFDISIIIIIIVSCRRPFHPGTSLEPAVIPTAQASSFTLQYFPYYV